MSAAANAQLAAEKNSQPKSMAEQEDDFGYHPRGTTTETLDDDRRRRESQTFAAQLRGNMPMTIAASSVCGVLLYGLWKSLLSGDNHQQQTKSQAKWMGLRVLTQGAAFASLFGFAVYSGRLWAAQESPLRAAAHHGKV